MRIQFDHFLCTLPAVCAALLISGCGGGGGDTASPGTGGSTPVTTPGAGGGTGTTTCQPLEILDASGTSCTQKYDVVPDVASCRPGALSAATRQSALTALNHIRGLHDLAPVSYDSAGEPFVMSASLMMLANSSLDHQPPGSWNCYSAAGFDGAQTSNLATTGPNTTPEGDFILWLTDRSNLTTDIVGHRRWLLDPFLAQVAYGRVDTAITRFAGASALRVIGYADARPAAPPAFVAYPFHDYPGKYHAQGASLSLSVVADPVDKGASGNVDFSAARIAVTQRGGSAVAVSGVSADNEGYGLANNLQFSIGSVASNTYYDVSVSNVRVAGALRNYSYWFRVLP